MADYGTIREQIRTLVDPLFIKFREELMGSGVSFGRLAEGALPTTTVVVGGGGGTIDPDDLGYIRGIKTYSGGIQVATEQTELSFVNAHVSSTGARTTVIIPSGSSYVDPLTTNGDILYRAGGVTTRLPIGAPEQFLRVNSGLPVWETVTISGGTSASGMQNPMTTLGDMIYALASGVPTRLPIGADGTVLAVDDGIPTWVSISGGIGGSVITAGPLGSEPVIAASGDLHLTTNAPFMEDYNGSVWLPWGPIHAFTSPPTSSWSWVNQGSASIDTTNGGIYLTEPGRTMGTNFRCYVRNVPSVPYTIDVYLLGNILAKDYLTFGLVWRQSSDGKCVFVYQQYNTLLRLGIDKFNSPSSFNSEYQSTRIPQLIPWLRITDNNTNRLVSFSTDGQHWTQYHSIGRTDFLTADQVGIFVSAENAVTPFFDSACTLLSWKES